VLAVACVLRLWSHSPLWFDEALSVNIARLPVPDLLEALRHDGSPPLYYLLLHGWMALVGTGDVAVRALSGAISIATLPLAWTVGRRLGPGAAWPTTVLVATSPFLVRYASETRMYALVALLTMAGLLALLRVWEAPTLRRAAVLGAIAGALLLTHYWALYLWAVVAGGLAWLAVRPGDQRRAARTSLAALGAGAALFLPWAPSFVFQALHTGTPWADPVRPAVLPATLVHYAQGTTDAGAFLHLVLVGLLLLGSAGAALVGRARVDHRPAWRRPGPALATVALATVVLAALSGAVTDSAYTWRYTSIAVVPTLLVAAVGVGTIADRRARAGVLACAAMLGLLSSWATVNRDRTQAVEVAAAIRSEGQPGDLVVYCPDQLGPAVHRLLPDGFVQSAFPEGDPPQRVDWVDYDERQRSVDPQAFANRVLADAPERSIFLVWSSRYGSLGPRCQRLADTLAAARPPERHVSLDNRFEERMALVRYPAG
jgi:uncharacterized membrane protein